MTSEQLWSLFQKQKHCYADYSSWHFCNDEQGANHLAQLVLEGVKKGTASCLWTYEEQDEPIPAVGDYSIVLNWSGEAVCIIQTTEVAISPFKDVTEAFARIEGEGDGSLKYWRDVHQSYFIEECDKLDIEFSEDLPVVCETFEVVFKL